MRYTSALDPEEEPCLWCGLVPVTQEGEVCSYQCYSGWIYWHQERDGEIIKVEEGMAIMLPLELQTFHKNTWKAVTE